MNMYKQGHCIGKNLFIYLGCMRSILSSAYAQSVHNEDMAGNFLLGDTTMIDSRDGKLSFKSKA